VGRRAFVKDAAAGLLAASAGQADAQSFQAAIHTRLTELFGLAYPIVLAPMGSAAGGELAAAVSNAGGLGLVGGGFGNPAILAKELETVKTKAKRKWGVGLITWRATEDALRVALSYKPDAFWLSFGDPLKFSKPIKSAGCVLICQVQDVDGAIAAKKAGADFIVAQGTEAGGHGASTRSTLPLVPAVMDAVAATPVLAAGGIADGRGVAAALALGAVGVAIGTRFCASKEALYRPAAKERLLHAKSGDTIRTSLFDEAVGVEWPAPFTGRALRNRFFEEWNGKSAALKNNDAAREEYRKAQQNGDFDTAVVWAGEGVDLISGIPAAGELLTKIGRETVQELRRVASLLG
jgi:nitronate monooxygenase